MGWLYARPYLRRQAATVLIDGYAIALKSYLGEPLSKERRLQQLRNNLWQLLDLFRCCIMP